MTEEAAINRATAQYPPADITSAEFETVVAELFGSAEPLVKNLVVTEHEVIQAADGEYDFDATAPI